uniref:RNA-directed DNA polymerase, eukaryota n=1 Tax=Tanacetum cinerariifolium TaxID=118510 RepID=A0A699GWK9_TANCI|nr:RNA-directed DNA polymerase, eukaryota [Tanacetum cinerariifolium]
MNQSPLGELHETSNSTYLSKMWTVMMEKEYGTFPKCGNSSFITLIPKMHDAKMMKDFRPITLIGSLYKMIAKILSNHRVVVLGDIVLESFYRDSVLRINMNKRKLMGVSLANVTMDQAAAKIGCATLEAPLSYLGLKVMSRVQSWNEIVNNPVSRLSNWKMKTLSIGGKLTLLKSILALSYPRSSLWARVIKGIHGEDGKLGNNVNHSHLSIWLDIVCEMEQLKNHYTDFIGFIHKKLGEVLNNSVPRVPGEYGGCCSR